MLDLKCLQMKDQRMSVVKFYKSTIGLILGLILGLCLGLCPGLSSCTGSLTRIKLCR